ncbi:MAG: DUF6056 family protein [Solobacterium sp.]|nr:DUF6056 family protein [Solobacterium sp.]
MSNLFKKKNFYILASIFVLMLFAYITCKTPLAGDDWGYALNGSAGTPIKTALEFYNSWSGRFFSELWGMIVPGHKWIWNIVNPLLFMGIFICIYKLAYVQNKPILCSLLILAIMLSVDDNLRMETYSWIMGTTYIIPLFLSLLYFVIVDNLLKNEIYDIGLIIFAIIDNLFLFIIGLMMENIAASMIVGIVFVLVYAFLYKKKAVKYLIPNLVFSILSFVLMRMSPGSASRLNGEHVAWAKLSLFEKLANGYPNFLNMTFIENNYAILLFSICLILLICFSRKKNKVQKLLPIIILLMGIITVFSFVFTEALVNPNSVYSFIFWPVYIINAFYVLFTCLDNDYRKNKALFMLMFAGCNALVMLYSPIYGSRSAIYTVYYLIVVSILILDFVNINKHHVKTILLVLLVLIIGDRTREYIYKYRLVGIKQNERLEIIKYYQDHPEVEEAWIPRFPIFTVHGADVEIGDTYHFETFKDYYNLPQDADKIIFYYEGE